MNKAFVFLGRLALVVGIPLALVGACSVSNLASHFFGWDRPLFTDGVEGSVISPDGRLEAFVTLTRATTVRTTRLRIRSTDDLTTQDVLVLYKDVQAPMTIAWRDAHTLQVGLPCHPPIWQKQSYDFRQDGGLRRAVIEYHWTESACVLDRGLI